MSIAVDPVASVTSVYGGRVTRLIARDDEVGELLEAVATSVEGPALRVVSGVRGVGKSAILEEVGERFAGRVLRSQAVPWDSERPWGVIQQMTSAVVRGVGEAEEVLRAFTTSGTPVLLVVEDAHWADVESLRLLSTVVRLTAEGGLRVILVRSPDASDVSADVEEFFAVHTSVTTGVRPLDALGVAQLATGLGVAIPPLVAERLLAHTGGRARHVVDLVLEAPRATWSSTGRHIPAPRAVRRRVAEQLEALSPESREFVEAVAVLQPHALIADVATMAGVGDALASYEDSERAGLTRAVDIRGSWSLEMTDPMIRQAVLDEMGAVERAAAHARAAALLTDPVGRLRHRVAASVLPDAGLADELDEAAATSASDGAWAEAAELLTLASRLTSDRPMKEDRLLRAMDALVGAGDALAATALAPEVESFRETPLRNAVLGYLAVVRGRSAEADVRLSRAWDIVNSEREPAVAALICQRRVLDSLARCRAADLVTWVDRAVDLVQADSPAAVESRAIKGLGVAGAGDPLGGLEVYRQAAEETQHGAQSQRIVMGQGWLFLAHDDIDEARAALQSALRPDFLGGSTRIALWAHGWLARALFVTGEWDEALEVVDRGTDLASRSGMALMAPLLQWTAAQIHALRGDWGPAEEALRHGDAGALDYSIMRVPAALARAHQAEARADYPAVLRALAPLTHGDIGDSVDEPGFWPWADIHANALVMEGRLDEAETFLDHHERVARARGHRSTMARLGYARGRLHGALGDLGLARAAFERSLELLDELPLPYDRARVNFAYGQTLRRAGKRREADAVMRTARELFVALGAISYVARCDRELKAGGVSRRQDRGPSQLTPQETSVGDLVARGRSNREVATELFISVKTVQYHLTRTYAKLGVRSRSELAAMWIQDGDSEI